MSITDPRIDTELAGYRIEALLGRGGMGVVDPADDLRLKRKVALKLLAGELSGNEHFRERFLSESELAASIDHPNILPIYGAGEIAGQLYIAMRYVDGTDLKQLLRREGALDPEGALAIVGQIAAALDAAHALGLVHRDVKPSNVLLNLEGHAYLADFGLSRRTTEETEGTGLVGTIDYVAPEQIRGEPVDGLDRSLRARLPAVRVPDRRASVQARLRGGDHLRTPRGGTALAPRPRDRCSPGRSPKLPRSATIRRRARGCRARGAWARLARSLVADARHRLRHRCGARAGRAPCVSAPPGWPRRTNGGEGVAGADRPGNEPRVCQDPRGQVPERSRARRRQRLGRRLRRRQALADRSDHEHGPPDVLSTR